MKTIEERAEIYEKEYPHIDDSHYSYYVRDGYIQGATEQKQIDDEEYRKDMRYINTKKQEMIESFRKALIEETWEAAQESFLDAYCQSNCNLDRKACLEHNGMCKQYERLLNKLNNQNPVP